MELDQSLLRSQRDTNPRRIRPRQRRFIYPAINSGVFCVTARDRADAGELRRR